MSTAEYLGRAQLLVEDLAQAGQPMPLDEQNLYVFRGLRPEFRVMASSLAVSGTPVTLPQLSDYLQAQTFIHSDDFLTGPGTGAPTAMVATRGRQNGGGRQNRGGGRPNQWQNRGGGRGGQGRGRGGSPRCQICRSHGHTAIYCFRRYSDQPSPPQANVAVPSDGSSPPEVAAWYPDTGASSHATPDPAMMSQSEGYTGNDVLRIGNSTGLSISSTGCATIPSVSKPLKLSNILHVPDLSISLLSVHRFTTDNNVFFEFHPEYFVVKDRTTKVVLLKGPSSGGLYSLTVPQSHLAFLSARASSAQMAFVILFYSWMTTLVFVGIIHFV
ncbi:PREDICTED: uncharacterized protein LOC109158795 [Ipomoea nil]|uniref:uncharacterized protein LOC109158795 n=1 Tax=Ipomoea nil TaxID=35883 RepID=UPI000900ABCC|nr:PREDICTED: uncharacterized protein LOC109158795 [Ipomoea nil]